MEKKLTEGTEWKKILLFALPIMAGTLLQQLYNTVDGLVVGNYVSSNALAAVGSSGSLALIFVALGIGMGNGCGIVISQFFGAREYEDMRKAASTILILFFAMGLFFTVLGVSTTEFVMRYLIGIKDDDIFRHAVIYFRVYAIGILFQFVYNAVSSMLRSIGDSRATLYFLLVSTLSNIGLDMLFVAVFRWEVFGAALATIIAQFACALFSWMYMIRRYEHFRFKRKEFVFDGVKFRLCLKMGIPTTIQQIILSSGMIFLQRLINSFGAVTMSAYAVGTKIEQYLSIPSSGFYSGMAAFAGQNTGAGRPDRVKRGMWAAIIMNLLFVGIIGALQCIFAEPLAAFFGVSGQTLSQSIEYIVFIAFAYPLLAFYLPINGMFQGAGVPLHSMGVVLLALGGRVIGAYVMVYAFGLGYASCWQSSAIGWTMGLTYSLIYYFSGRWKNRKIKANGQ